MRQIGMLMVVVVFALSGCGEQGASPAERAAASKSAAAERAVKARQEALAKKKAKQTAIYEECRSVAVGLDDKLNNLNSRLGVGMPFAEYGKRVGDASVAYDEAVRKGKARGGVSESCINRVFLPLQTALNAYTKAYNVWNDCNADYNCDINKADANKLIQGSWSRASTSLTKADDGLAALQPA